METYKNLESRYPEIMNNLEPQPKEIQVNFQPVTLEPDNVL